MVGFQQAFRELRRQRKESLMKNHFENATPEKLAKALQWPVRKPKRMVRRDPASSSEKA